MKHKVEQTNRFLRAARTAPSFTPSRKANPSFVEQLVHGGANAAMLIQEALVSPERRVNRHNTGSYTNRSNNSSAGMIGQSLDETFAEVGQSNSAATSNAMHLKAQLQRYLGNYRTPIRKQAYSSF